MRSASKPEKAVCVGRFIRVREERSGGERHCLVGRVHPAPRYSGTRRFWRLTFGFLVFWLCIHGVIELFAGETTPLVLEHSKQPDVVWRTSAASPWTRSGVQFSSPAIGPNTSSWLEMELDGPVFAYFSAESTAVRLGDRFGMALDGLPVPTLESPPRLGYFTTPLYRFFVPPGRHVIRWTYDKGARSSGNAASDPDRAIIGWHWFSPWRTPTLSNSLLKDRSNADEPPLIWTTGGQMAWGAEASNEFRDGDGVRSGAIVRGQRSSLEVRLPGSGVLSFGLRLLEFTPGDHLRIFIDDRPVELLDDTHPREWVDLSLSVGDGVHVVRWEVERSTSALGAIGGRVLLDEVNFSKGRPLADVEAGIPDFVWTTGGSGAWIGVTSGQPGREPLKTPLAVSGNVASGEESWLSGKFEGPGLLSYWARLSTLTVGAFARIEVDGIPVPSAESTNDSWQPRSVPVPRGVHVVRWSCSKETSAKGSTVRAWLYQLRFRTAEQINELFGGTFSSTRWFTGGDAEWRPLASSRDGALDSVGIEGLRPGAAGWIEMTLVGSAEVKFLWRMVNAEGTDSLRLWVDGGLVSERVAASDPERRVVRLGEGNHRVRWELSRGPGSHRALSAEIRDFQLTPFLPLGEAVGSPAGIVWTTGGDQPWVGATGGGALNFADPAARSGTIKDGQQSWMEATLQGPGELGFRWTTSSELGKDVLRVDVDGGAVRQISGARQAWDFLKLRLDPGIRKVRWTYVKDNDGSSGSDQAWVDEVVFRRPLTLDAALNDSEGRLTWSRAGDADWGVAAVQRARPAGGYPPSDEVTVAQSPPMSSPGSAWVETTIQGPKVIQFSWKVAFGTPLDRLSAWLGDKQVAEVSGHQDWEDRYLLAGPGSVKLRFRYSKESTGASPEGEAILDAVTVRDPPLVDALFSIPELVWSTGGDKPWFGITRTGVDAAAASGTLGASQQSWIQASISGPGWLDFSWNVSSELDHDWLTFEADGVRTASISGASGTKTLRDVFIPEGRHRARWSYETDAEGSSGMDSAWMGGVKFEPVPTFSQVLNAPQSEAPGLVWRTGGAMPWLVSKEFPGTATSGLVGNGQESWLETTVEGPATLQFTALNHAPAGRELSNATRENPRAMSSREVPSTNVFRVLVADEEVLRIPSDTAGGAREWRVGVPTGNHRVRWSYSRTGRWSTASPFPAIASVTVARRLPVGDVLGEGPSIRWRADDSGLWLRGGLRDQGVAGRSVFMTAARTPGERWIEAVVDGPGDLVFSCMVQGVESGDSANRAILSASGLPLMNIPPSSLWITNMIPLRPGRQTVRWSLITGGGPMDDPVSFGIKDVSLLPALPLNQVLDSSSVHWTTGGEPPWQAVRTPYNLLATSGYLEIGEQNWLEARITGPCEMSFEPGNLEPGFYAGQPIYETTPLIDGKEDLASVWRLSGPGAFNPLFYIPPGDHVVRWRFRRVGGSAGCLSFKAVVKTDAPTVSSVVAAGALRSSIGGDVGWRPTSQLTFQGVRGVWGELPDSGGSVWIENEYEGPGRLWFDYVTMELGCRLFARIDGEELPEDIFPAESELMEGGGRRTRPFFGRGEISIPAGRHRLRLTYEGPSNPQPRFLRQCGLTELRFDQPPTESSHVPTFYGSDRHESRLLGSSAVLSANLGVLGSTRFQWRKNGLDIAGATLPVISFESLSADDAGVYNLVATSVNSVAISPNIDLSVVTGDGVPGLAKPVSDAVVRLGAPLRLEVPVVGSPPLNFTWYLNGQRLEQARGPVWVVANVRVEDLGSYLVRVENPFGSFLTAPIVVRLDGVPRIFVDEVEVCSEWMTVAATSPETVARGMLRLAAPEDGATIYYTVDGAAPTPASNRYTSPVALAPGAIIRAMAVSREGVRLGESVAVHYHALKASPQMHVQTANGRWEVSVQSDSGWRYGLEQSVDLQEWSTSIQKTGDGGRLRWEAAAAQGDRCRFFRLRCLPPLF